MPSRMPYIQWFPADWLAATTMLTPATRGIWFDILNAMWLMDRAEKISGTLPELARAGRCDAVQMQTAIDELTRFHVADVTERNGLVTIVCRRYKKANAERVRIREAVQKTRCNGNVTEMLRRNNTEDRRQNNIDVNFSDEKSTSSPKPEKSGASGAAKEGKIYFAYEGDGKIHGISGDQLARWREMFPAIDVDGELRAASAWLDGNRKLRKKNVRRFLTNWLIRKQDAARGNNGGNVSCNRAGVDYAEVERKAAALRAQQGDDPRFEEVNA